MDYGGDVVRGVDDRLALIASQGFAPEPIAIEEDASLSADAKRSMTTTRVAIASI